jgi:D-serine deaminase-like pyridoxal phosphate-dependent protein
MDIFSKIEKPTLLLNKTTAIRNIRRMAKKAADQGIRLRPHFKTHQSVGVGQWFRDEGISAITVSSVDMANYFQQAGWNDILLAFPANWRQVDAYNDLARQVHLDLLVESPETAAFLDDRLDQRTDVWIKIDVGAHRTGLDAADDEKVLELAKAVSLAGNLSLRGLITHAGHTYGLKSSVDVSRVYHDSVRAMKRLKDFLTANGFVALELSVGDTPGCSVCDDLGAVDEIRPGNFVFYDAEQYHWGNCQYQDVAVALAVPVVAKHSERREVVIYGGAVHLSKDHWIQDGQDSYGDVAFPAYSGWGARIDGARVARLSQEHGIVHFDGDEIKQVQVGDLLCILPAHSCLTVSLLPYYLTLDGEVIKIMGCC